MTTATVTVDKAAVKAGARFSAIIVTTAQVSQLTAGNFTIYDAATGQPSSSVRVTGLTALNADGTLYDPTSASPHTQYWRVSLSADDDVYEAQLYLGLTLSGAHDSGGPIDDLSIYRSANFFIDSTRPELHSVIAKGRQLLISYRDDSGLDAEHPPAASAFSVTANGVELAITAVAVDRSTNTVTLTLERSVTTDDDLNVSYTDPSFSGDDTYAIQDQAGNDAATFVNAQVTVSTDNTAPTMAASNPITFSRTAIKSGETTTVTFRFSEAVRGFDLSDVVLPDSCTLTNLVSSDPSMGASATWTATLTGKANVNARDVTLAVRLSGVTDTVGNSGSGTSAASPAISIDTRKVALVADGGIRIIKTTLKADESTEVVFTFTETLNNADFTADDIVLSPGWTISNPVALDGSGTSTRFKATLTPPANNAATSTTIAVRLSGVRDGGPNSGDWGEGTSPASQAVSANTARPTLQTSDIVFSDRDLRAGETSSVTFTFSEAVTGFDTGDVTGLDSASLSNMQALDASGRVITGANPGSRTWRATLTPNDNAVDAINKLTVNLAGVRNATGNAGAGTVDSANYALDTHRPTLLTSNIAIADADLRAGETSSVTFTFSEAVSGFGSNDVTVENGALSNLQALDANGQPITGANPSSSTWRATLTPTENVVDATNKLTVNLAGVTNAAGTAGTGTVASGNYAVNTSTMHGPTLQASDIVFTDSDLKAGETGSVSFTFSEAVSGFATNDVTVENGSLSNLQALDANGNPITGSNPSSTSWRATLTPADNTVDATNKLTVNLAGVSNAAGNAGVGTADSANYSVNTQRPTLQAANIIITDTDLKAGETSAVTFTFSEAVSGFDLSDVSGVENGSLSNMQALDANGQPITGTNPSSITWRATLTPANNVLDTSNKLTVNLAGVSNAAGNAGAGTVDSANYSVNTQRPTLQAANIVITDTDLKAGETSSVTFTFSEAVSGFGTDDVSGVQNGSLSNVQALDANGNVITGANPSSTRWRATLTPADNTVDATNKLTVNLAGVSNAAGNAGTGTVDSANYSVNTQRPTLQAANIVITDTDLKAGETSAVTFTFSEAVSGFDLSDVSGVENGSLSNIQALDANGNAITGANPSSTRWRATLTPADNTVDATNKLTVNLAGVSNAAGNPGIGTVDSANYSVNTQRPTLQAANIVITDTDLKAGETSSVTFTFSEAVSGFDLSDVSGVENGSLSNMQALDANGNVIAGANPSSTRWRATLTPADNTVDATNKLTVNLAGVSNAAGNVGVGTVDSANYSVNTQRPTPTDGNRISVTDSDLKAGETSSVTFIFSEAVSGFDINDVTVENGSLSNLQALDANGNVIAGANPSSTSWRATLTPADNTVDATNKLTVNLAGVINTAGNAGAGTVDSANYSVNTQRPTLQAANIVITDIDLKAGETSSVTFTFSEAVSGFDLSDVNGVENGSLSNLQALDANGQPITGTNPSSSTWRATLTPANNVLDTSNKLTVNLAGVNNAAGNAGAGTVDSANYSVNTQRPTLQAANIVITDTDLKAGETSSVTFTFSEAVSGFDLSDVSGVENGSLSNMQALDANGNVIAGANPSSTRWRATLTPADNTVDATNKLTVNLTGVSNAAGNAGTGTVDSANYLVNTQRPTLQAANIVITDTDLKAGETSAVTFTFSEAVSGFDLSDVSGVENGSLSNIQALDANGNAITGANPSSTRWRATLTPADNTVDATNKLTVNLAGVSNAAGNAGAGMVDSANYAVNTQRPTLQVANIVITDTDLKAGETSAVTFTFSEAVSGFDLSDVSGVENGSLSNMQALDANGNVITGANPSSTTWRATLTPANNVLDTSNKLTVNLAGVSNAAGNTGAGTVDSANYSVNTQRPTPTDGNRISVTDSDLKAGETSSVTFTFSEAVSGFDINDVTVENGALSNLQALDANGNVIAGANPSSTSWRATLTPADNTVDATNKLTVNLAGVINAAGNAGAGTVDSANYSVNTQRPTLQAANIVITDTDLKAGETSSVTFTFSEAVSGFDLSDVSGVENGSLSNMQALDANGQPITGANPSSTRWRATLAPADNTVDATNKLTVSLAGVSNAAGNAGAGMVDSANYAVNTQRPTLQAANIVITDTDLKAGETSSVTFTFSEAVSGFDLSDVSGVENGSLSNMQALDANGNVIAGANPSSTRWRATLTPADNTVDATNKLTVSLAGVSNAAGNAGTGTVNSENYLVNTQRPTLQAANIVITDTDLKAGETSRVTFTFSEAVSGFDLSDVSGVENGSLSNIQALDANGNAITGTNPSSTRWRATLTPADNTVDATNKLTVNLAGVSNAAGNAGTGTVDSENYLVNTQRPTLQAANIVITDTDLKAGETSAVTFTFSEAVSGFDLNDISGVENGSLSNMQALDANGNVITGANPSSSTWRATLTPANNVLDTSNKLTVNLAGVSNAAGNAGAGTVDSANYSVNTQRPTPTDGNRISVTDSDLKAGETSSVSFTFSEAVSGFDINDVTVENGSLSNMQALDVNGNAITGANPSSTRWRATLTPADNTVDATNKLTVNLAGVSNAAGNAGTGTVESANYSVNTQRPTLQAANIVITDTDLKAGETSSVTFTFSEAVSGFGTNDVTVENGALSNLQALDASGNPITGANPSSTTWRATLTPANNVLDTSNKLTVNLAGVSSAAGNTGTGAVASGNYAVDTLVGPMLHAGNIAIADNDLKAGETSSVSFTFSEAVSGLDINDVTVENGSLSNMQALDANGNPITGANPSSTRWRATLTPADNTVDATNKLTVNLAGVSNAAGNAGTGTVDSANYSVNTQRPTLTGVVFSDTALKAGETSSVTFTFSEAVSGFDSVSDVTVPNGSLGSMQALDANGNPITSANPGSNVWRATFTPNANAQAPQNKLTVNMAGVVNAAGNAGAGSSESGSYAVDTLRPTLTGVVFGDAALKAGETSTVTFTFSEAVTGFGTGDVTAPNGRLSNLQALHADGSVMTGDNPGSKLWRATLEPNANVQAAQNKLTVNLAGVQDAAGNAGAGSAESGSYAVDTLRPTLAATDAIVLDKSTLRIGESTTVTFNFSEAVSGFTVDDVSGFAPNASLTNLQAIGADGAPLTGNNASSRTWRATLTPEAGKQSASNALSVNLAGVTDSAGNVGQGSSANSGNFSVDTVRPTVSRFVVTRNQDAAGQSATYQVQLVFSEKVAGLTADKLTAENASISNLTSSDGGTSWSATLTAKPHAEDASNQVQLNLAGVTNAAGNGFAQATAASNNYAIDDLAPVFESATVDGARLVLYYADGTGLDAEHRADPSAFVVRADGVVDAVTAVAVDAASKTVTLTLAYGVAHGQVVTVSYSDPTGGDDLNATQDAAGNDAASLVDQSATNYTPAPVAAAPTPAPAGTDTDRDGVSDSVENQATGLKGTADGDGNGDGIPDSRQGAVTSASFAIGATGQSKSAGLPAAYLTLVAGSLNGKPAGNDGASSHITGLVQKDTPENLPKGLEMSTGLTSFTAEPGTGVTSETFSLYVDASLGINGYWMKNRAGVWVNLASKAYGGKMVTEGDRLRLDFKITDGGEFDSDGQANGTISASGAAGHMALSILGHAQDGAPDGFWL